MRFLVFESQPSRSSFFSARLVAIADVGRGAVGAIARRWKESLLHSGGLVSWG